MELHHSEPEGRLAVRDVVPTGMAWDRAQDVRCQAIRGGHLFPVEAPEETEVALHSFLAPG